MNLRSLIAPGVAFILMMAGASFAYALGMGEPNPLFFAIRFTIAMLFLIVALAVIVVYGPVFIVIMRGVRREFEDEDWMCVGDWHAAFSSRDSIRRAETLRLVQTAHPKVPEDLHDWFGEDARRVFRTVSKAADFKGGKYRIAAWLETIRDADIRDFDTLIGYIEVAGVEPAVFAIREDMPIEYARSLFVVS